MIRIRTLTRRLLALFLLGGVVAASSGFAIHDPDCIHHAVPGERHHLPGDAGADEHGLGEGMHGHPAPEAPAEQDCECLGFCAVEGAQGLSAPHGTHQVLAVPATQDDGSLEPARDVPVAAPSTLLPPATGPPVLV